MTPIWCALLPKATARPLARFGLAMRPWSTGCLERALGPDGEAEDLTQDVFLTTFARLPTLREHGRSAQFHLLRRTANAQMGAATTPRAAHLAPFPHWATARIARASRGQRGASDPGALLCAPGRAREQRTHGLRVATHGRVQARRDCRTNGGIAGYRKTLDQPRARKRCPRSSRPIASCRPIFASKEASMRGR